MGLFSLLNSTDTVKSGKSFLQSKKHLYFFIRINNTELMLKLRRLHFRLWERSGQSFSFSGFTTRKYQQFHRESMTSRECQYDATEVLSQDRWTRPSDYVDSCSYHRCRYLRGLVVFDLPMDLQKVSLKCSQHLQTFISTNSREKGQATSLISESLNGFQEEMTKIWCNFFKYFNSLLVLKLVSHQE